MRCKHGFEPGLCWNASCRNAGPDAEKDDEAIDRDDDEQVSAAPGAPRFPVRDGSRMLSRVGRPGEYERRKGRGRAKPKRYIPEVVVREEQWSRYRLAYDRAAAEEFGLTFAEWVRRALDAYCE